MARIAFVLGNDFEDNEFRKPYDELRAAGHDIEVLGTTPDELIGGKHGYEQIKVDASVSERDPASYDAVVIPGGDSPDKLRMNEAVVRFVQTAVRKKKLVAAVDRGPQLLIEAGAVEHRKVTSYPSIRTDLINAGANWIDNDVVRDGNLITAGKEEYLPAFTAAIREQLSQTTRSAR